MIPQMILLGLLFMSLGFAIANHGKEKEGKHNAWISLLSFIIWIVILSYAGFFDVFYLH